MIEITHRFPCPYCGMLMSIPIDVSAGSQQKFVYDCETCCAPILCLAALSGEEVVSFQAERES